MDPLRETVLDSMRFHSEIRLCKKTCYWIINVCNQEQELLLYSLKLVLKKHKPYFDAVIGILKKYWL